MPPLMEHPTTLQYDFDSFKLSSFFCKKAFKRNIYIYVYTYIYIYISMYIYK